MEEVKASPSSCYLGGPMWRRLLANHVSTYCQPRQIGGVVDCLESCIMITNITSASGDCLFECKLSLPRLFKEVEGPGPLVLHKSAESEQLVTEMCFMEAFMFCCSVAPILVRLQSSMLRDTDRIREVGNKARVAAYKAAPSVTGSLPWVEACWGVAQAEDIAPPRSQGAASGEQLTDPSASGSSALLKPVSFPDEIREREHFTVCPGDNKPMDSLCPS